MTCVRYAFWCLAVAATLAGTTRAQAFDFFGLKLFDGQQQADQASLVTDPEPYKVTFSTGGATGALDSAIRNASGLLAGQDKPASGVQGLLALARGDYQGINAALYGQGYYGGTIHILLNGREATTIPIDAALGKPVAVTVAVTPGPLFHFGRLTIANPAPPTSDPGDQVPSPQSLGFVTGAPALSGTILSAEKNAVAGWRQLGYPNAKSIRRDVMADHRTRTVDVAIALEPGPHAIFGQVGVKGTETVDPAFVAYMTGLTPGEEYDPDAVARANKRLQRLEMFRSESIADQGELGPGGMLPIQVAVQEQPGHRTMSIKQRRRSRTKRRPSCQGRDPDQASHILVGGRHKKLSDKYGCLSELCFGSPLSTGECRYCRCFASIDDSYWAVAPQTSGGDVRVCHGWRGNVNCD